MTLPTPLPRRPFLRASAAALGAAVLPTWAQGRTLLRVSTPAVPDAWHARMWTVFKDQLAQQAKGVFDVQIHLNGTLFKQGAEPTAMARGNLELASVSPADLARQLSDFSVFTAGYMLRDPGHQQRVFAGPIGAQLFHSVSEKMGLTLLATCYLGTRQLGLRQARRVQTNLDLKGLKLRMPATKDWLFLGNALGASATPLAFGEVYLGLKTGTIDAQDNPLPTVRAAKFHEVMQQIVLTSHLVDTLFIAVSSRTFAAMPPTHQQALRDAAAAAARYNNEQTVQEESQLVDFLRKQGLQVTTPDVAAFRNAVQSVYQQSDYARSWSAGLVERINATN